MSKGRVRPRPLDPESLAVFYLTAKETVIEAGFADEIDWQEEVEVGDVDEQAFLREAAWVVLAAGFRESVLRRRFAEISRAFLGWSSADAILADSETCRANALNAFGNRRKIGAVFSIVEMVSAQGMEVIRQRLRTDGVSFLREVPFLGPVTVLHLAKNLGLPVVKPDRHLVRMAGHLGYEGAEEMCETIAQMVGDPVAVIDIVLWRHATLRPRALEATRAGK
jgi:hypothetical protein